MMIATLKRSSLAISRHLGLSDFIAHSGWRRQRLLILCYHGIALHDEHEWNPRLYMATSQFEQRLSLIRQSDCTVLPLAEALTRLYRGDLPERAIALTFDDGYYDFAAKAWPILERFGYPATVYLTTARVLHNRPIVNLFVSYILWKARDRVLDGNGVLGLSGTYSLRTAEDRQRVVRSMDGAIQAEGLCAGDKDDIARTIAERVGLDYQALIDSRVLTLMNPDEVSGLSRRGLDIQLHTHLHRTPEDPQRFVADVLYNQSRIEAITGRRPTHLCYPSGVYRLSYVPALEREGIESGTTCDPGMATRHTQPLLLPRFVDTAHVSEIEFEAWLTGVAECLPRRTKRAHPAMHATREPVSV